MDKDSTEKRLSVRIDPSLKDSFLRKVDSEGKTATNVIHELVRYYLSQDNQSDEIQEVKKRLEQLERIVQGECVA